MVILCDAKHYQKLKYLIYFKHVSILHFLKLALAFLFLKYLDFYGVWRHTKTTFKTFCPYVELVTKICGTCLQMQTCHQTCRVY